MSFLLVSLLAVAVSAADYDYGMVIDAGSTHSALFVYRWEERVSTAGESPQTVPVEIGVSDNTDEGISTCCGSYAEMVDHLTPLIEYAEDTLASAELAEDDYSDFPIYLKATAGMRVLAEDKRTEILEWVREFFSDATLNPFAFEDNQAIIISGEEEATFGWLTVNYLRGALGSNAEVAGASDTDVTYGSLDLGGKSTQIAWAYDPSSDILEGFTGLKIWDDTYRLYTQSFLGFGTVGFEYQLAQLAFDYATNISHVTSPCFFEGWSKTYYNITGADGSVTIYGDSTSGGCSSLIKELFYNDTKCLTGSCSILGVYQPPINHDMTFYAFGGFGYLISNLGLTSNITLNGIQDIGDEVCAMTWAEFQASTYGQRFTGYLEQYQYLPCQELQYVPALLGSAYGFDRDGTNLIFGTKYNGSSLGWATGSILRDVNWLSYTVDSGAPFGNDLIFPALTTLLAVFSFIL